MYYLTSVTELSCAVPIILLYTCCHVQVEHFSPSVELRLLSEKQKVPVDLDTYIKKLTNSRKRILLVNDILQNVQVSTVTQPCQLKCCTSRH